MCNHYTTPPFDILPQSAVDAIFDKLSTLTKFYCSLVCKAWQHVPHTTLHHLPVGTYGVKLPPRQLPLCIYLRSIHVSSSHAPGWRALAQQLTIQQLASLQELHIQHSSNLTQAELLQLQQILQVQGHHCGLYLAVTDKPSLLALLEVLPMQGLVQLDLNTPYLFQGAADMLSQAAALQALCNSEQPPSPQDQQAAALQCQTPRPGAVKKHIQQHHLQHTFSIGVWVCCWGGCSGIDLEAALAVYQQLKAAGCYMYGCESINCKSSADVSQLQSLQGLRALGFSYKSSNVADNNSSSSNDQSVANTHPHDDQQEAISAVYSAAGASNLDSASCPSNTVALSALVNLQDSLQHLTIHGCPSGGFAAVTDNVIHSSGTLQDTCMISAQPPVSAAAHPLAALTGLTKLSLLKQWGSQPPLPLSPLSHLTLLRELAVERQGLSNPQELNCLSVLLHLKVLSLNLAVEAEQLQEDLRLGRWAILGAGQQGQRLQGESCGAVDSVAAAMAELSVQEGGSVQGARQELQKQQATPEIEGLRQRSMSCTCFCDSCSNGSADQEVVQAHTHEAWPNLHGHTCSHEASSGVELASTAVRSMAAEAAACPSELLQQLMSCPFGRASSPVLLDWSWLLQLTQLQVAWLQVPHLDLACLPPSLVELDAQQPHDLTTVGITCTGNRQSSSSGGSLTLPNLKRMVLPRTLQVSQQGAVQPTLLKSEDKGARLALAPNAATAAAAEGEGVDEDCVSVSEFSEGWSSHSSSDTDNTEDLLHLHNNAQLLLWLSLGCCELRELQLVQWQLPVAAVVAAAHHLRHLRVVSIAQSNDATAVGMLCSEMQQVRNGTVKLELQEQLVLSRYPWSSVLDQR